MKIGNIILFEIEKYKDLKNEEKVEKYRKELKNINILLKKIESKKYLREKRVDFLKLIKDFFDSEKNKQKDKDIFLDKSTSSYLKTLVLIRKYKEKKMENNKNILKNIYLFLFPEFILKYFYNSKEKLEQKENLLLRKEVINQNLIILQNKANNTFQIKAKFKKIQSYIF